MSRVDALDRRRFLGAAALSLAAGRHELRSNAMPGTWRLPTTVHANTTSRPSFVVKQIDAGVLNVGYAETGPSSGPAVVLLHGWPYDIHSFVDVAPLLAARGYRVIMPYLRGYGTTRFRSANTPRNGQQSSFAADTIDLMDALGLQRALIAGFDWGSRSAAILGALWPERCKALVLVSGYLINNLERNQQPLPPRAELGWWYQFYFSTDRGRRGYEANRYEFNKLIWKLASPTWDFDEATYARTAASFENADHVAIVIHNYRWRLSLVTGEPRYDELERKVAHFPPITVPSITIASDFDGAAADGRGYAARFTARYAHRVLDGIGHNVPQEAPQAFAQAIVDVDHF